MAEDKKDDDIENDPMFGGIVRGAQAHARRQMEEAERQAREAQKKK